MSLVESSSFPLEIIRRLPHTASNKPPILCIHGAYHAAWCWDEHFAKFFAARGYETIAFSLRGHGQSAGRQRLAEWGLADYLLDVIQIADTFQRPLILMGHSLGGLLALMYLAQREAEAAILLAPAVAGQMRKDAMRWLVRHPWASVATFLTRDMRRLLPTFRPHFFSPHTPPDLVDRYMARMQEESYRVLTDQARLPLPIRLRRHTPLLIVHGQFDSIRLCQHQALAAHYGARLEVFPLGHELMLEPDWRLVAECAARWLGERGF